MQKSVSFQVLIDALFPGNMSQLGIKKITMDTESIPEATLTKLFNGQVSGDAISEFDDMVDGFSLNVTVTTAFIDRIELYANENEENFRESEIVAYKLTMAPIGNFTNQLRLFERRDNLSNIFIWKFPLTTS